MNRLTRLRANQPTIHPHHWIIFWTLAGFGLRVQQLSFQPLWGDEGWSFYFTMQPVSQLLALTAVDIHPPLYYLLLKGWLGVTGSGPETARLFSVAAGTLLIPLLGVLGRRLFEPRVGAAAAAVAALMPLAVYYSQEVRMYGLVTLLAAGSVYLFCRAETGAGLKWRLGYVVATAAALYTMYYAVFVPVFQFLYILLARRQSKNWRLAKRLWLPVAAGLLYLPWGVYAGPRLVNYVQNKRAVEGYAPLDFARFFSDHLAAFSVGHLAPILQPYIWAAAPFVAAAVLGGAAVFFLGRSRRFRPAVYLYLYLFLPLVLGYVINRVYPFTPPYYERTLLLAAPAYWLFIAAGLVWLWDRQYLLVGTVVMAMLLVSAVSLVGFYTRSRYPRQDYRPLLAQIAARATPNDTLLASYQWQLGFYQAYLPLPRPRFFQVPGWGQGWAGSAGQTQRAADLANILAQSPRLWFPAHQALGHMWEDEAETTINGLGYPALLEWYGPQTKLILARGARGSFTKIGRANFDNRLSLLAANVGNNGYQAGRDIVPVELTWQKQGSLGSEHRVSLRLADALGRTWATRDSHPRAGQVFFTDLANGDTLVDRHGLLIPAGTPPGRYRLLLSIRRVSDAHPLDLLDSGGQPMGAELLLNEIEVIPPSPPVGAAALPVQVATNAVFNSSVRLVGYSLGREPFKAGESLPLSLFWQSLASRPPVQTVQVQLLDAAGEAAVLYRQSPLWPADRWQNGSLLHDRHDVPLPPTLRPGNYRLVVSLLDVEQTPLPVDGRDQLALATITTIDRPHNFEPPRPIIPLDVLFGGRARLVGIDLPRASVKSGDTLPLTLHWQAAGTFNKSWTVFVHLLNQEGQIVSQQDQLPGGGRFPTTGWLPDEYLEDSYNLLIPPDTPPGREAYRLEIGLYDANDFSRLPVMEGQNITGDHLLLESWPITVE